MGFPHTKKAIPADFFTPSYRISCRIGVPAGGLHALLLDPLNPFLELGDAYVSRINTPGEIVAHYQRAAIRKDNILFIVLTRREDGDPPRGPGVYVARVAKETFVTIPSFEIRGTAEVEQEASPREILVHSMGRFVPIYDASASVALFPDITFEGKLILINKERVEAFCIVE